VTLTYDPVLSRVQITATALAAANVASVERSTDQIRWTTVRGASAVTVTAGALASTVDDYEFSPNVVNYYRVRGVETGAITFVALGASSSGSSGSRTPGAPAGMVAGDMIAIFASTRNSGTGTVNTPTGWTKAVDGSNCALLTKRWDGVEAMPTITFTGGAANEDTLAQIGAWRRASPTPLTSNKQLNGSAQNIARTGLSISEDRCLIISANWKQDDWTGAVGDLLPGALAELSELVSTAGNDAAQDWEALVQTTASNIASGTCVITGGAAAISRNMIAAFPHADYLNEQTSSITPTLTTSDGGCASAIWLKSIARPFLNQAVDVVLRNPSTVTRPARVGIFDVVGRTLPIAVSDVHSSRRWTMYLRTETQEAADNLDYLMASGDVLLIQTPPGCTVPSGYVVVGDVTRESHPLRPLRMTWTLPCTEVAPPSSDVVGVVGTWQTVISTYATWTEVIAARASWADLITLVGDPSEVIVA
jgi:hypothetical protein